MRNAASQHRNIALVGPMGSGKSHVGRLLAARLGLAFVDIDVRIETDAGLSIPAIFANEGEAGFRLRESRLLADALAQPGQVIATGGGAVLDTVNRAALCNCEHVIYLQVELAEQLRRVADDSNRPLLAIEDRAQRLAELQVLREPLYREVATHLFDTSTHAPDHIAEVLAMLLASDQERHA